MSEKIEDFTFLGSDNKPYRFMMTEGQPWIYWLHPNNNWVTHTKINIGQVALITRNLTDPQQSCYPPSLGEPDLRQVMINAVQLLIIAVSYCFASK